MPHVEVASEVNVETAPLAELVDGQPTLMKIDVEGWERHVIAGAYRLLSSPGAPHLLVEFADVTAANAGATSGELAEDLELLGYRSSGTTTVRVSSRRSSGRRYGGANLVATKRIEELRARLSSP